MSKISGVLMFLLLLTGCAGYEAPFQPPVGYLYTNIKAPLKTDVKIVTLAIMRESQQQ